MRGRGRRWRSICSGVGGGGEKGVVDGLGGEGRLGGRGWREGILCVLGRMWLVCVVGSVGSV